MLLTRAGQETVIKRSVYGIAGQTIATRVSGDPVHMNNGIFYFFNDHLGSTASIGTSNSALVSGSRAYYLPFGGYRGPAPTQAITDRDFTGQRENMELGLLYYQARFYVPGIGRFASADTIVPDPANPQQYNRYTYTLNNPLRFVDPTGHCAENGAEACWGYLESQFCNDGLCEPGQWWRWVVAGGDSVWTIEELKSVREALLATLGIAIQNSIGLDDILPGELRFAKGNICSADIACTSYSIHSTAHGQYVVNPRIIIENILQFSVDERVLLVAHEIGHAIELKFTGSTDGRLVGAYVSRLGYFTNVTRGSNVTWSPGGVGRGDGEIWADVVAARIYREYAGKNLSSWPGGMYDQYTGTGSAANWDNIYTGVDFVLRVYALRVK